MLGLLTGLLVTIQIFGNFSSSFPIFRTIYQPSKKYQRISVRVTEKSPKSLGNLFEGHRHNSLNKQEIPDQGPLAYNL